MTCNRRESKIDRSGGRLIQEFFKEAREKDELNTPDFQRLLERPFPAPGARLHWWKATAAVLLLQQWFQSAPPAFPQPSGLSSWSSPTEFLLRSPARNPTLRLDGPDYPSWPLRSAVPERRGSATPSAAYEEAKP